MLWAVLDPTSVTICRQSATDGNSAPAGRSSHQHTVHVMHSTRQNSAPLTFSLTSHEDHSANLPASKYASTLHAHISLFDQFSFLGLLYLGPGPLWSSNRPDALPVAQKTVEPLTSQDDWQLTIKCIVGCEKALVHTERSGPQVQQDCY